MGSRLKRHPIDKFQMEATSASKQSAPPPPQVAVTTVDIPPQPPSASDHPAAAGAPPGLEYLALLDQVLVQQQVELVEGECNLYFIRQVCCATRNIIRQLLLGRGWVEFSCTLLRDVKSTICSFHEVGCASFFQIIIIIIN